MTGCPVAAGLDDFTLEPEVPDELPPELQAARRVTAASAARAVVVVAREGALRPVGSAPKRLRNLMPNLLMALSGAAARLGAAARGYPECRVPGK